MDQYRNQSLAMAYLQAVVVDNDDSNAPDKVKRRRVKIRASSVHGDDVTDDLLPWATACVPGGVGPAGEFGDFSVPLIGAKVLVVFQQGDPHNPIYLGGVHTGDDVAPEFKENYPHRYGYKLSNGTLFYVDQSTNRYHLEHAGTTVDIDEEGNLTTDVAGNMVSTVAGDNTTTVSGKMDITVSGTTTLNSGGQVKVVAPSVDVTASTTTVHGNVAVQSGSVSVSGGSVSVSGGSVSVSGGSVNVSGGGVTVTGGNITLNGSSKMTFKT